MIHIETGATDTSSAMVLFRNVLAEGTLAASTAAADGAGANALGPQTYDFWVPTAMPATLAVTLGSAVSCDACAIVAHTLGSSGATLIVQYFSGTWQTVGSFAPTDDADLLILFPAASSTQWRIQVTGSTIPAIGVAMIGPRLLIPGGVRAGYVPTDLAVSVELMPSVTIGGQFVGTRVNRRGAGTTAALVPQERTWIEGAAAPFIAHYNEGGTFIWASAPAILTNDMAYCWRSGDTLSASYNGGAVYGDMTLELSAYVG
jgi:hypothetical protein